MACIFLAKGVVIHFTSELLGKPLIWRARGCDLPFLCLPEVAVLSSSGFPGEMWPAEDSPYLVRRFDLILVIVWLGTSVADIILKVSLPDEFFNVILKRDAFFRGVANISMVSTVFVLILL